LSQPSTAVLAEVIDYLKIWGERLSEVVGQITGAPLLVQCATAPPYDVSTPAQTDVWLIATSTGGLRGEMAFRLSVSDAVRLAHLFLGEPPDAQAELTEEGREAVLELFRQVAGHVASALKPGRGEVQLQIQPGGTPSWAASAGGWLIDSTSASSRLSLEVMLSAELMTTLGPGAKESRPVSYSAAGAPDDRRPLGTDVDLAVSLRFGGRRMLLRDILGLSAGALVELDRQVQEPVELLLDGKIVARGEALVINGNYGLRVTELLW